MSNENSMSLPDHLQPFAEPQPIGTAGFVRLVDVMGDDGAVVQAARVSYGAGTKTVREDAGLIRYLMRHHHTTPFEMCELKLHVKVPMDTWRQWIRHRMASVNEYSTRYSEAIDDRAKTPPEEWRLQSRINKQGSAGVMTDLTDEKVLAWLEEKGLQTFEGYNSQQIAEYLTQQETDLHQLSTAVYKERLALGVAREVARKDLPLSTYTEAYWKIDLHNLLHFLQLRVDSHAQKEIREFAEAIANIVKVWVPATWAAFEDYRLNAHTFSGPEMGVLRDLFLGLENERILEGPESRKAYLDEKMPGTSSRERKAFLTVLGLL